MVRSRLQILHYDLTRDFSVPDSSRETDYLLSYFVGNYIACLLNSDEALELVRFARETPDGFRQSIVVRRRLSDIKVTIETPVVYA